MTRITYLLIRLMTCKKTQFLNISVFQIDWSDSELHHSFTPVWWCPQCGSHWVPDQLGAISQNSLPSGYVRSCYLGREGLPWTTHCRWNHQCHIWTSQSDGEMWSTPWYVTFTLTKWGLVGWVIPYKIPAFSLKYKVIFVNIIIISRNTMKVGYYQIILIVIMISYSGMPTSIFLVTFGESYN